MPGRLVPIVTNQYYHIYNRGSDKREIVLQNRDFSRFQQTINYYQFADNKRRFSKFSKSDLKTLKPDITKKLVDILCYCLMPNHFHLLVKQLKDNGIPKFLSNLCNSYTRYFNTKHPRVGPLLQGKYQSVLIESENQLIHTSRYIHLNPVVSGLVKNLDSFQWSSYNEYTSGKERICSIQQILSLFPSPGKYKEFVESQIDYGITLQIIKHQVIDIEG